MPSYSLVSGSGISPDLDRGAVIPRGRVFSTGPSGTAEVRSDDGANYQFGPNSNFAIEDAEEGSTFVYGGEVWAAVPNPPNGKYRTSCYLRGASQGEWSFYVKGSNALDLTQAAEDSYLCRSGSLEIYEFVDGQRISLATLRSEEVISISFDPERNGADAYQVRPQDPQSLLSESEARRRDLFG